MGYPSAMKLARIPHVLPLIAVLILSGITHISGQTAGAGKAEPVTAPKPSAKKKTTRRTTPKPKARSTTPTRTKTTGTKRNTPTPTHKDAVYYFDYALYSCGSGDLECKLENFTRSINLSPRLQPAYFNRAIIYFQKKFYNSAIADYTKVIEIDEENAFAAYNNRAWTYCHRNMFDRALEDANRSLELKPDYPEALDTRGTAYMGKGEYRLALDDFNRAIKLAPSRPDMYKSRAALYRKMGKTALAQADERKMTELVGTP